MGDTPSSLLETTRYLHEQIPLTAYMGVKVVSNTPAGVRLFAPLAPNLNHCQTVFGGSAASLATLACWTLLRLRLQERFLPCDLVVRRSQMEYNRPMAGDFNALCSLPMPDDWQQFISQLRSCGKARINLSSTLYCCDVEAAQFEGEFVAVHAPDLHLDTE